MPLTIFFNHPRHQRFVLSARHAALSALTCHHPLHGTSCNSLSCCCCSDCNTTHNALLSCLFHHIGVLLLCHHLALCSHRRCHATSIQSLSRYTSVCALGAQHYYISSPSLQAAWQLGAHPPLFQYHTSTATLNLQAIASTLPYQFQLCLSNIATLLMLASTILLFPIL